MCNCKYESNISDKRTLNKMLELLNSVSNRISSIEMRATLNNINSVAEALNFLQIVGNTISIELQKQEKEEKNDGAKSDV